MLRQPFCGRCPDCLSCPPPTPKERELQDDLNVIIFSDHGMTDISWIDKVIELDNYINLRDLQQLKGRGPVMSLWPAPGKHSEVRRVGGGPSWGGEWGCLWWVFICSFKAETPGILGMPGLWRQMTHPALPLPGDLCPAVHLPVSSLV